MKAIETSYKGYKFRSRLEARWAVFFDALGIRWEYEKEGYEFSNGIKYLPDFWLPSLKYWIEIKGKRSVNDREWDKGWSLSAESNYPVFVLAGNIGVPVLSKDFQIWKPFSVLQLDYGLGYRAYSLRTWSQCPRCGIIDLMGPCLHFRCPRGQREQVMRKINSSALINAYNKARSARFEFGESG